MCNNIKNSSKMSLEMNVNAFSSIPCLKGNSSVPAVNPFILWIFLESHCLLSLSASHHFFLSTPYQSSSASSLLQICFDLQLQQVHFIRHPYLSTVTRYMSWESISVICFPIICWQKEKRNREGKGGKSDGSVIQKNIFSCCVIKFNVCFIFSPTS